MKKIISDYGPGIVLFVFALIIGMLIYQDYGISWDETIQRPTGLISYDYVFNGKMDLLSYKDRQYGVGFEFPLIVIEKLMNLTDSRDIYLMRHLVSHIFFLVAALSAYVLVFKLYRNKFLACVAFVMLVTEPRLYAHSFFNTKDLPFLSMLLITLVVCQIAFDKNKTILYFILGMFCGYTTSIRIMGTMLAGIVLFFLIIDLILGLVKKENIKKSALNLLVFPAGFCIVLYVAWPYLWGHPVARFIESFSRMSHFDMGGSSMLFRGALVPLEALPWTYLPVWLSISTPVVWLLAGFAGMLWIIIDFFRRPLTFIKNGKERNFLLYVACFTVPILSVIFLHSILYDDWRHMYFIYPSFLLMGIYFINKILQSKYRLVIQSAIILQLGIVCFFMIKNHPFQQVYFNELVSHDPDYLRKNYELEYWGASYKQGLDYLVNKYHYETLKVSSNFPWHQPLNNNILLLSERDRKRIWVVDRDSADYFITNFRGHPEDFKYPVVEYTIKVLNSTILTVYKTH